MDIKIAIQGKKQTKVQLCFCTAQAGFFIEYLIDWGFLLQQESFELESWSHLWSWVSSLLIETNTRVKQTTRHSFEFFFGQTFYTMASKSPPIFQALLFGNCFWTPPNPIFWGNFQYPLELSKPWKKQEKAGLRCAKLGHVWIELNTRCGVDHSTSFENAYH